MKKKTASLLKALCFVSLALVSSISLLGQNYALEWYGLDSFVLGPQYAGGTTPYGDTANPAASAWTQRPTLDLSYFLTLDTDGAADESGHVVNLGFGLPSSLGVFSFSGRFGTSNLSDLPWGTWGSFNTSFSKDLLDELSVGVGLGFQIGQGYNSDLDWGLGLDLGFVHKLGDVAFLKDFAWGASFNGLGKAMYLGESVGTWPSTFTPGIGTKFKLIKDENAQLGFNFDLDFPTFQNLQFNAGLDLELFNTVRLMFGYDLDVAKLIDQTDRYIPINFGVMVNLGGAKKDVDDKGNKLPFWSTSEYKPGLVFAPLQNNMLTFGTGVNIPIGIIDTEPPVVTLDAPDEIYISPNFDGIQDELEIPLTITDSRYIESYTLYIYDEQGNIVRIIRNKEERPENMDFETMIKRFFRKKTGLSIPEALLWDGQGGAADETVPAELDAPKTEEENPLDAAPAATSSFLLFEGSLDTAPAYGQSDDTSSSASGTGTGSFKSQPLPDGVYTWVIEATDDNGNVIKTSPKKVVVDTTPPELILEAPLDKGFAPGGDRPAFVFGQKSSPEDSWQGTILDSDNKVIRTFNWTRETGGLPPQGIWDGRTDAGDLAKDGVYSYVLSSTDRAGNFSKAVIDNIMLLNRPTPVGLIVENAWFSPNNDGVKDTVLVAIDASRDVKIQSWRADFTDANGIVVRTWEGSDNLPKSIVVDGKNNSGQILPEGNYILHVDTLYQNGNHPLAQSPEIILDLTPPSAVLNTDYRLFSPDGDGEKDSVRILHQTSEEPLWTGTIKNEKGELIQKFTWRGKPDLSLDWNGKAADGSTLPDGQYTYQVSAVDQAGNLGQSAPLVLTIDSRPSPVTLNAVLPAFSPNGDGVKDTQTFSFALGIEEAIESWEVSVVKADTENSTVYKTWKGSGIPREALIWDGKDSQGKILADGDYQALGLVVYQKGNKPKALSRKFALDTKAPTAKISPDISPINGRIIFSPDGDGIQDTLSFAQESSVEELWTAQILDASGKVLKTFTSSGTLPKTQVWDGTDANGNRLKDDTYSYVVSSTDTAGNTFRTEIKNISLDTKPTPVSLNLKDKAFSPNGDGIKDSLEFNPILEQNTDIREWSLSIQPASGGSARTLSGTGALKSSYVWDGKTDGGRLAPEGEYFAKLSVDYLKGTRAEAQSSRFFLDLTPPKASAYSNASLFSPDGDGRNDSVTITMDSSEENLWTAYMYYAGALNSRSLKPASDKAVMSWQWKGKVPKTLVWDGTSAQGITVQDGDYLFQLESVDEAGNKSSVVPVNIQVDTRPISLKLDVTDKSFSPNGDGKKDRLALNISASLKDGIDSWKLEIRDSKRKLYRSFTGKTDLPSSFDWDGKDDSGKIAPEGTYRAELSVLYLKGNNPSVASENFLLDVTPPALELSAEDTLFSPDGDGLKDLVKINQKTSAEDLWEGKIKTAAGKLVRTLFWKGQATNFAWDGKDENGNRLEDGSYTYEISSTDAAGNTRIGKINSIVIDTRPTSVLISASARGFAPNSAVKSQASISFKPYVNLKEGIDSWTLDLRMNDQTVHSLQGTGLPPETLSWNGMLKNGNQAPEGRYEGVFTVEYTDICGEGTA